MNADTAAADAPDAPPTPVSRAPVPPVRRRRFAARFDLKITPYLYVAPFFVLFAIFGLYPVVYTVWISLTNESPLQPETSFVGLENFTFLLTDGRFWNAVANTMGIFVLATVPQLLMALILANWLNRALRGMGFFRMAIAIPVVTSTAVVGLVFGMIFARDFGLANWILESAGIDRIDWRADRWSSWVAIATMVDWRWTGYNTLIYLAGMQAISGDLYEAAELDGASRIRQFWQITVPLLKPTIIFTVIISTIGGLQLFTEPVMFTTGSGALGGGSLGQFQTVTMYLVQNMRIFNQWGYAGAISLVLFLLIIAVSALNFWLVRRISSEK
jgi:cellobiose transport system permease protein